MREVQVQSWCDECFNESEARVPTTATFTVAAVVGEMTHPPVKVLEFCDVHAKRMTELMALLAEVGQTPGAPARKRPAPGRLDLVPSSVVAQHPRRRRSGNGRPGIPETLQKNPETACPICNEPLRVKSQVNHMYSQHLGGGLRPPQPNKCPTCGTVAVSAQGMATHRALNHGWNPMDEALAAYRARQNEAAGQLLAKVAEPRELTS